MAVNVSPEQAFIRISQARGLVTVLQTIKSSNKSQQCALSLESEGLRIRWEDDSKSLQSSVYFRPELFAEYRVPWATRSLGVHLWHLMDVLLVCTGSTPGGEAIMRFPGPSSQLLLEATENNDITSICTYANISSLEMPYPRDLNDYWQEPASHFLLPGELLKEAVEDMEWAAGSGSVRLTLKAEPPVVELSASSTVGDLRISFPADRLAGFHCEEDEVQHLYKHKHLRTAFANLPATKDASSSISSKVTLDAGGIMKVTHMLSMAGVSEPSAGTYVGTSAFLDSQRPTPHRLAVVTFLLLPQDEGIFDDY